MYCGVHVVIGARCRHVWASITVDLGFGRVAATSCSVLE